MAYCCYCRVAIDLYSFRKEIYCVSHNISADQMNCLPFLSLFPRDRGTKHSQKLYIIGVELRNLHDSQRQRSIYFLMWCVCVCMCSLIGVSTDACVCSCGKGPEDNPRCLGNTLLLLWGRVPIGLELSKKVRLACQGIPEILLSLCLQCWGSNVAHHTQHF